MDRPLVSVVVPTYNAEQFVTETIESILAQSYPNIEIICVDDGSTDGTYGVLESFGDRVRIIRQQNAGPSAARNAGIKAAAGRFIGLLDADDLWEPEHVAHAVSALIRGEHEYVRGLTRVFRIDARGMCSFDRPEYMPALVGACLYALSALVRIGLFDETMPYGEDIDWHARATEAGLRELRLPETSLRYRKHAGSITAAPDAVAKGQFLAFRRKLARSRGVVQ